MHRHTRDHFNCIHLNSRSRKIYSLFFLTINFFLFTWFVSFPTEKYGPLKTYIYLVDSSVRKYKTYTLESMMCKLSYFIRHLH